MSSTVKEYVIYKLLDPESKAARYVGKTHQLKIRIQQHPYRKNNVRLSNWFQSLKLIGSSPDVQIIEHTDCEHWPQRERYWIRKYRESGHDLFNIADGGDGLDGLAEEVRRHLSEVRQLRKLSPEHLRVFIEKGQAAAQTPEARARRIASLTGRISSLRGKAIHNELSRKRISEALSGRPKSIKTRGKLSAANLGHKDSQATREKKSASHRGPPGPNKGRTFSAEVRQKQSIAHLGKKRDHAFKKKMSEILTGQRKRAEHCRKISQRATFSNYVGEIEMLTRANDEVRFRVSRTSSERPETNLE